jgi:hypothetical protein
MRRSRNEGRLASDLASLPGLSRGELCGLWRQHYGREPIPNISQPLLIMAVAYRMQEKVHGGLSGSQKAFLNDVAAGKIRSTPTVAMKPGTVLMREWHGTMHEVTVLARGYLYRDQTHRSLTGLARQITGIHRSGPAFFGVMSHAQ